MSKHNIQNFMATQSLFRTHKPNPPPPTQIISLKQTPSHQTHQVPKITTLPINRSTFRNSNPNYHPQHLNRQTPENIIQSKIPQAINIINQLDHENSCIISQNNFNFDSSKSTSQAKLLNSQQLSDKANINSDVLKASQKQSNVSNFQPKSFLTSSKKPQFKKTQSNSYEPILINESVQHIQHLTSPINQVNERPQMKQKSDKQTFLQTKVQILGYLKNHEERLQKSLKGLEHILESIQKLVDKNFELEEEKIKNFLYKIVDRETEHFIQCQRKRERNNKMAYEADALEIKTMLEIRVQEIQHFSSQMRDEREWKKIMHDALSTNYEHHLDFIVQKYEDIEQTIGEEVKAYIYRFNEKIRKQLFQALKLAIQSTLHKLFANYKVQNLALNPHWIQVQTDSAQRQGNKNECGQKEEEEWQMSIDADGK